MKPGRGQHAQENQPLPPGAQRPQRQRRGQGENELEVVGDEVGIAQGGDGVVAVALRHGHQVNATVLKDADERDHQTGKQNRPHQPRSRRASPVAVTDDDEDGEEQNLCEQHLGAAPDILGRGKRNHRDCQQRHKGQVRPGSAQDQRPLPGYRCRHPQHHHQTGQY